ncbi:MAG: putative toxin-antitoxin system toxin component, PIN family [Cyclobacteriaceae bacterium]
MANKTDRVVIDTNLWISFLITKDLKKLDSKIKSGRVKFLFSLDLVEEFLAVANRPKFKKYFSKDDLELLLDLFDIYGELVQVESEVNVCRDPKDNFLLALAKDSKANYLLTGDKDLLSLKKFQQTKIIEFSDFIKKIN